MAMNCNINRFSSYTKGLYEVADLAMDDRTVSMTLIVPAAINSKLEKKFAKFDSRLFAIDGVASVAVNRLKNHEAIVRLSAIVAKENFLNSSLARLKVHDRVSIGVLSSNPDKYLLDASSPGTVLFKEATKAEGHRHTLEYLFECSEKQYEKIQRLHYIGLNGSGFYIQSRKAIEGRFFFSVHAGRNTREKTVFGLTSHPFDTPFTLTMPSCNDPSLSSHQSREA